MKAYSTDRDANRACRAKASDLFALRHEIVRHLPRLRRYARALTGSQKIADEYIRGCLETLLEQPELISRRGSVRVQLFKLFHRFADRIETSTAELSALADPIA